MQGQSLDSSKTTEEWGGGWRYFDLITHWREEGDIWLQKERRCSKKVQFVQPQKPDLVKIWADHLLHHCPTTKWNFLDEIANVKNNLISKKNILQTSRYDMLIPVLEKDNFWIVTGVDFSVTWKEIFR